MKPPREKPRKKAGGRGRQPPSRAVREAEARATPEHVLTGTQVVRAYTGARILAGHADPQYRPPEPAGLRLALIIRELHPTVEELEERAREIRAKHGLRRNGKLLESIDGAAILPHKMEVALADLRKLYAEMHDVRARPVRHEHFEGQDYNAAAAADMGPLFILPDLGNEDD